MRKRAIGCTTRRAVFTGIAAALAPRPLVARAQSRCGMRRLGVLMGGSGSDDPLGQARGAALVQGLGAQLAGWRESAYRLALGWRRPGAVRTVCGGTHRARPEVLVAWGSPGVAALRRHSSTIPIVIVNVTDLVGQGFVESLARPGGNITGFTDYDPPKAGKWLWLLTQLIPPVVRAAILFNPATAPFAG